MTTMHKCDGCDGLIEGDAPLKLQREPSHPSVPSVLHFHSMDCLSLFTDHYRGFLMNSVFGPTKA